MKYNHEEDFCISNSRVILTESGIRKMQEQKITGTKISRFFNLDREWSFWDKNKGNSDDELSGLDDFGERFYREEHKEFMLWSVLKRFPDGKQTFSIIKKEAFKRVEQKITEYLNRQLGTKFIGYPVKTFDVFLPLEDSVKDTSDEMFDYFGGVPDGENLDDNRDVISILEVKSKTRSAFVEFRKERVGFLMHILQLSLYIYLRNLRQKRVDPNIQTLDSGYLCICFRHEGAVNNINTLTLTTDLKSFPLSSFSDFPPNSEGSWMSRDLESWISDIGRCNFKFRPLEVWSNEHKDNPMVQGGDCPLFLFKFQIDLNVFEKMLEKLKSWWKKYEKESPKIHDSDEAWLFSKDPDI